MRPRLASLALLLLALCRQSAGGLSYSIQSFNTESSKTSVSLIPKQKQSTFTKTVSHPKVKGSAKSAADIAVKLFDMVPNTIILGALAAAEVSADVPFLVISLYNGALCDFKTATSEKFNQLIYNNPAGDRASDEKAAKEDNSDGAGGYECSSAPQTTDTEKALFKCFCTEKKALVYCGFLTMKEHFAELVKSEGKIHLVAEKPCRDVTVPALVNSGPLGKLYDLDQFSKNTFKDAFDSNVDAYSNDEIKAILCDATNPAIEEKVKAVYASDGLYWITESLLYSIVFGPPEKSLTKECEETDFKNKFGECVCEQTTGFTFCIYKVIGQAFKDAGYLKCDGGPPAFVAEKKPEALPQLVHKGSASGSGSKDGKASATTFSLLTPAAAAAALLLRQ